MTGTMKHTLSLPWGFKHPKVRYDKNKKVYIFEGFRLPPELRPYAAQDFSLERWYSDEMNGSVLTPQRGSARFKPRPHQIEAAKAIKQAYDDDWSGLILADKTGLGKGLAASTIIPTPNGNKTMGELKVGDLVYGADGKNAKIIQKNKSSADKFYKITFSDGVTVLADSDHRWATSTRRERNRKSRGSQPQLHFSEEALKKFVSYLELMEKTLKPVSFNSLYENSMKENGSFLRRTLNPISPVFVKSDEKEGKYYLYHPQEVLEELHKNENIKGNRWGAEYGHSSVKDTGEIYNTMNIITNTGEFNNHSILIAQPIVGEEKDLPIDPYILGVWLGDGGSYDAGITTMDTEIVELISKQYNLRRVVEYKQPNKSKGYFFEGLSTTLRKLYKTKANKKITKYIPQEYMTASIDQRMKLLKGLLDTDGSISKNNGAGVSFCQKDHALFMQVYQLITGLGWKSTKRIKKIFIESRGEYESYYELLFFPNKQVFKLERKANILTPSLKSFGNNKRSKVRYIVSMEKIQKDEPYYCISVDSHDHLYLITEGHIPTHNTLSTLVGLSVVAKEQQFSTKKKAKVLIVCPKGVIPQWRNTLHNYPIATSLMRPMIINYERMNRLLIDPPAAKKAKKAKTKNRQISSHGKPAIDWDFIVFDEAHYLKNYPKSAMSVGACNVAGLNKIYNKGKAPFVIYSTATPGATPLNFGVMAQILAPLISQKATAKKTTPNTWGDFLHDEGFAVKQGKVEWAWATTPWYGKNSEDPVEQEQYKLALKKNKIKQRKDTKRIGKGLTKPNAPFLMRSPSDLAGWPEQQFIPLPIALTDKQYPVYQAAWTQFRTFLKMTPARSDPKAALVEMLRFRQKSSLLKVEQISEQVIDWVNSGHQVFVSCQFIESVERYAEILNKAGIKTVEISGRNPNEREEERLKFQKGEAQVCLCTVVAGISLHSNEDLPDGTKATKNPRITVMADIRQNNLDTIQGCGRAHRSGENSLTYFPYLEDTVDKKVIDSFVNKQTNMATMTGADEESAEELEQIFRKSANDDA